MPNHTQEKIDNEKHRMLLKRNKLTLLKRKEFILLPHMEKKKMRKKEDKRPSWTLHLRRKRRKIRRKVRKSMSIMLEKVCPLYWN